MKPAHKGSIIFIVAGELLVNGLVLCCYRRRNAAAMGWHVNKLACSDLHKSTVSGAELCCQLSQAIKGLLDGAVLLVRSIYSNDYFNVCTTTASARKRTQCVLRDRERSVLLLLGSEAEIDAGPGVLGLQ
jgi:hypothetical protein